MWQQYLFFLPPCVAVIDTRSCIAFRFLPPCVAILGTNSCCASKKGFTTDREASKLLLFFLLQQLGLYRLPCTTSPVSPLPNHLHCVTFLPCAIAPPPCYIITSPLSPAPYQLPYHLPCVTYFPRAVLSPPPCYIITSLSPPPY